MVAMMPDGADTDEWHKHGRYPVVPDNPFGLTRAELHAEIDRLLDAGWMPWELQKRFGRGSLAVAA
ncbi:MAG TPA: hypothetical protein VFQ05_06620 [Candidatus Eisenbacteria bacterium]|nr:hypothetical protein [Candidatus Eisenbacteria bacterium]